MNTRIRLGRIALPTAAAGSALVCILLLAARLDLWMEGAYLHPTPRINALTVGLALVPVPVLAWIVFLWTRPKLGSLPGLVARAVLSCLLLALAGYSLLIALFMAFFVG
jgi:hypothetical protein